MAAEGKPDRSVPHGERTAVSQPWAELVFFMPVRYNDFIIGFSMKVNGMGSFRIGRRLPVGIQRIRRRPRMACGMVTGRTARLRVTAERKADAASASGCFQKIPGVIHHMDR